MHEWTEAAAVGERKTRGEFRLCHRVQVRFRDCDPMGHANNAVYFTYVEQARFAYWREVIHVPHDATRSFIIARAECDYKSPARPGEWLDVWIRTVSIGRSSFVLQYEILSADNGRMVAVARTVQVMFDYEAGRSIPVPDDVVRKLEAFEGKKLRVVPG